jgi:colanic acid biosynthesis glycosyl transferase WcaI
VSSENKFFENKKDSKQSQTLWVVSELYYPEMTSTGYYLTKIAEGLTDAFDVKVICGQPNYSARGTRAPASEIHKKVRIFRARGTTLDKNVIIYRIVNMLSLSVSVFFKCLFNFRRNEDALVVTTPPSLPFVVALASVLKKTKYTLLIHDNYPEILVAAGKTDPNSLLVKFTNYANRLLYRRAKKIIVVGRDMRELVGKKLSAGSGRKPVPVDVIQNWAELEQVAPLPREENSLLEELKIKDKFVFLYAGNMGYPNDLESLVFCAAKLKADKRFHFIFLGAGVKRKWLEKQLLNVSLLEPRPRSEQKIFLNACDVGVVSLVGKMRGVSMPSRTYNILAAGKPILALTEKDSELAKVIEEDQVGWTVAPNDPETLLKTIYTIYSERSKLAEMSAAARRSAVEKYSLDEALAKYRKSLTKNASDND